MAGASLVAVAGTQPAQAADTTDGYFYTITPDRLVDTRNEDGPISAGQSRLIPFGGLPGWTLFFNLTVVNTAGSGFLAVYDADYARPNPFSSINWQGAGKVVANSGLVPLGEDGFRVYCGGPSGTRTNFIVDLVAFSVGFTEDLGAATADQDRFRRQLKAAKAG